MQIYKYPEAKDHVHDSIESYKGVVPFSKYHVNFIDDPNEADIYYMGQFSDGNYEIDINKFTYFDKFKQKHWCDIEGDWLGKNIPQCLNGCNITINGLVKGFEKRFNKVFVRPTNSTFLINSLKRFETFDIGRRSFGFMGYPDPYGVRYKLGNILKSTGLPLEYILTNNWNGPATINGIEHVAYEQIMKNNTFLLCPRGAGHDSVRFYEACFFGKIPILIGDNWLVDEMFGEDTSFCYKISQYSSTEYIKNKLFEIFNLPTNIIKEKCKLSRNYFDKVIRKYYKNPTLYLGEKLGLFIY